MRDPKLFFIGCFILLYVFYLITTGVVYIPAKGRGLVEHNSSENFPTYWLTISIVLYFGISFIKTAYKKKKLQLKPLTFKDMGEYNNYKVAEKSLGFLPFVWGIVGFFLVFPLWYVFDYTFNLNMNNCSLCLIDEDWSHLILFYSLFIFPVIFFKKSLKILSNRFINNGIITASSYKHMKSGGKPGSRFVGSTGSGSSDYSGGDCGGGE